MSTRCTVKFIDNGHQSVHAYTECFDDDPWLYIEIWQRGETANVDAILSLEPSQALALADTLAEWAAGVRSAQAAEAAKEAGQ